MSITYLLAGTLCISFVLNLYLLFKLKRSKLKPTYDAQLMLKDLLNRGALLRITRIDPSDVLLRSPADL